MEPVPLGNVGELFLGGVQVGRGYHNRPELTREPFIPSLPQRTWPATLQNGGLGALPSDGNIEFLGRMDHQVKIRGLRVELGEIESLLAEHPSIRHAVVIARECSGERAWLPTWWPAKTADRRILQLRSFLEKKLPDYLLPSAFVWIETLPLSPNGKVDRSALPEPTRERPSLESPYVEPRTRLNDSLPGFGGRCWA